LPVFLFAQIRKPGSTPAHKSTTTRAVSYSAHVLIETTLAATVNINGDQRGSLGANGMKKFGVVVGTNVIKLTSKDGGYTERKILEVKKGAQQFAVFDFKEAKAELRTAEEKRQAAGNKGSFTDPRDDQVYGYIKIGDQVWMSENLNYRTTSSWCYDNSQSNCEKYGRLYTWSAAKVSCPSGWHLPSDGEWHQLSDYFGGLGVAGAKLKATAGWRGSRNGSNISGFSGLPGGCRKTSGNYYYIGEYGYFWSSTQESAAEAWSYNLSYYDSVLDRYDVIKENGYSCRCLRDLK
jgi:uncharacterized protein (TIGR02145 family)